MVPWINEGSRFVDFRSFENHASFTACLINLKVKEVSNDLIIRDYILPLQLTFGTNHWEHYHILLQVISAESFQMSSVALSALQSNNFAVDGNRNLRKPHELYDHENRIFSSAFRYQDNARFLNKAFRDYRSLFLKIGLCQVDIDLKIGDYHCCLQAMAQRFIASDASTDNHLQEDSRIVLSPLTTLAGRRIWSAHDVLMISREKVFQSRTIANDEIGYRKTYVAAVATRQKLLCLAEIISPMHIPVC